MLPLTPPQTQGAPTLYNGVGGTAGAVGAPPGLMGALGVGAPAPGLLGAMASSAAGPFGTPQAGLVNLGSFGSLAADMAGKIPGPIGMIASIGGLLGRGYNASTADATAQALGLQGMSGLQTAGALLGSHLNGLIGNNYGALDGSGNLSFVNHQGYNNDAYGALAGHYNGNLLGQVASGGFGPGVGPGGGYGGFGPAGMGTAVGQQSDANSPTGMGGV